MLMSPAGRLARLRYGPNGYKVLASGDHVLCAITGERISVEDLRYWSVTRQEAYVSAQVATEALTP
ncbi:MAG: DUF2093 domain-containing protein [Sphingomonadaceae bacterium]